jgi:hypothetical protein
MKLLLTLLLGIGLLALAVVVVGRQGVPSFHSGYG